jgi:hypothetical protein
MKWFLIKVLFKLIDIPEEGSPKEHLIDQWMTESWQHPGFREYMRQRDKDFIRVLSGGLGATPMGQDDYKRFLGQRVELQRFGKKVQSSFNEHQRSKGLKVKT